MSTLRKGAGDAAFYDLDVDALPMIRGEMRAIFVDGCR